MKQLLLLSLTLAAGLLAAADASAACQLQLSDAQIIYAPVTRGELLTRSGNRLSDSELRVGEPRDLDILMTCDRPARLTLQFIGPAKESGSYRFGASGRATLLLHDLFIDDRQAKIGNAGKEENEMAFTPGAVLPFWQDGRPATGRVMRAKVTIAAWMSADATNVNEQESWQLNGSFVSGDDS
ncbi:MAG: hypothetical protein LBE96_09670 [Kalamiella piersonii]|uniref:hypothetical protein n=1 Tax=Pantoea piersonii TaxID=2364647 RepID=UPI002432C7F0|nr:hypothetical protein [Pantoea piersonii]MBZ6408136.1 hypothetical protein [Pantoea piersonii]